MSKKKSKYVLGVFAILIMMHHLSQKTSASWLPSTVRRPGLELFVPIGYLLVAFFFFCSGYGLIKSVRTKEDYMKGFLIRRLNRILFVFIITQIIYLVFRTLYSVIELPLNPYNWFIYTIVILYIGFYLFYRKENKYSFILMSVWLLGYSIICYLLVKGNWWINASPAFLVGIFMADHEEVGEAENKKSKKTVKIIISAVIFVVCFVITELANKIYLLLNMKNYGIINLMIVLLQIIGSSAFCLAIYYILAGMKEEKERYNLPLPQLVLSFFGGMTLEFYLIHGLFVQLFSHHFMNDSTPPVCYIKNVFLYVIVVFALSTVSAFAIKKFEDLIEMFYEKSDIFRNFCDDQKRNALIVIALFIVVTAAYSTYRHKLSNDNEKLVNKYQDEFISYVDVNGSKVATYMAGAGDYTIVLLGADSDCCPTLSLKPLADNLVDTYQVMIIDLPGRGYSEDTEDERTSDYMADVIHETLEKAGKTENIILVPNQLSSIYCYRFLEKYPEGVAGFVGVDAVFPALGKRFFEGNFNSVEEYRWYMKRLSRLYGFNQKFMTFTSYVRFQMPLFESMFYGSGLKEYYPVMQEMFIRNYMHEAHLSEQANVYDNCMVVDGYKLPDDFHAMFILDNYIKSTDIYGENWMSQYNKMISNKELQSIALVDGNPYVIYYNPGIISKKIDDFVGELEK